MEGLISMMGAHTVGAGKTERPMGTASVPAPRVRASTLEPGSMVSRLVEFTPGPVATALKANGCKENDMGLALKTRVTGFTVENGPKALRDAMVSDKVHHQVQNMKEHGPPDYKMDMVLKLMLTEVRLFKLYHVILHHDLNVVKIMYLLIYATLGAILYLCGRVSVGV